jgi:hypothetical protein
MVRFRKTRSRKWQSVGSTELTADRRDYNTRRVDELMLGMVIGRTRAQMHGTRTPEVMANIVRECNVQLPWELDDNE